MTLTALRSLHAIIGDALDDIERIYAETGASGHNSPRTSSPGTPSLAAIPATKPLNTTFDQAYASPPPSPSVSNYPQTTAFPSSDRPTTPTSTLPASLEFPSLDDPYDANSPSEALTSHPVVISAMNRIVAAAGQMSATVQIPFLTLCDAGMGFHLPSCLRLLEATSTVEILREAGPNGLHVKLIAEKNGVEANKLAHILRLLATHHILREVRPDVFANNRLSSILDTGKPFEELKRSPETKYRDTNGIAAFFGMCTDELFKSAGFLTEAYYLSPQRHRNGREPTRAPFNHAFGCEGVGFFGWLEGEGIEGQHVNGPTRDRGMIPGVLTPVNGTSHRRTGSKVDMTAKPSDKTQNKLPDPLTNSNRFRLERFGKAMTGTESWEVPGAVLNGFDWHSLPKGSTVVDVGGGIGSTSMLLAHAYSSYSDSSSDEDTLGLRFVIQDREVVVGMGEKMWKEKCPELLESGIARFQVHDFFTPQPIKNAAVFLLRVVLHDWPDAFAQRVLLRLREAAMPDTKLLIADFVLPLACADDFGTSKSGEEGEIEGVQGAEKMTAPAPLLPNLGKASANAYWMDMTMQVMFNGQERTLREIVSLAESAGWKVTKVTKAPGSLFGHIVAVPMEIPLQRRARAGSGSAFFDVPHSNYMGGGGREQNDEALDIREMGRASSRCGTPTFGSRMDLPSYEEARARFGGGVLRGGLRRSGATSSRSSLKPPVALIPPKKKRPSPLSVVPQSPSPLPPPRNISSPRPQPTQAPQSPIRKRASHAQLSQLYRSPHQPSPSPTPTVRQPPPSPLTPRVRSTSLGRRASLANLSQHSHSSKEPPPPLPTTMIPIPVRQSSASPAPSHVPLSPTSPIIPRSPPPLSRRGSYASLSPNLLPRNRSESIALPSTLGGRGNTLMRTLELSGGLSKAGSRSLDFGRHLDLDLDSTGGDDDVSAAGDDHDEPSGLLPTGSVLAAAARIENLRSTPKPTGHGHTNSR